MQESYIYLFFSACLINNFTLSYFLGLCPFFGVTQRLDTAFRLGLADIFVMTIASIAAWFLKNYILIYAPYLQTICFIVVIASTVQFVEMVMKKLFPPLFRALGIFLPLITTNCAIMGLAIFQTNKELDLLHGLVYAWGAGIGVTLALVIMAGLREESDLQGVPKLVKGTAMNFLISGILSMAFMGFAGLFSSTS